MNNTTVYLSIGSNVGDRQNNLQRAIEYIQRIATGTVIESPLYETPPVGPQDQGYFYNQILCFSTNAPLEKLLYYLKGVELILGRKRRSRWGAREIDCDILYYGQQVFKSDYIQVPHKEIANRLFVLIPFCDLNPLHIDPLQQVSVKELLQRRLKQEDGSDIRKVDV